MAEYISQGVTYSEEFMQGIVSAFVQTLDVSGGEGGVRVHLVQSPITVTPETTLAELEAVECDYTGYQDEFCQLFDPANFGSLTEGCIGSVTFMIESGPVTTDNDVVGYWIQDGGSLVAAEMFADEDIKTMANVGDYLTINVKLGFSDRVSY